MAIAYMDILISSSPLHCSYKIGGLPTTAARFRMPFRELQWCVCCQGLGPLLHSHFDKDLSCIPRFQPISSIFLCHDGCMQAGVQFVRRGWFRFVLHGLGEAVYVS
jgi:hypothetical protein